MIPASRVAVDPAASTDVGVVDVKLDTPAFAAVLKLGRAASATLGFMPEGGFAAAAEAGCLVAALTSSGSVVGYAMFRRSAQRVASITHLCVDPSARGAGLARLLFEAVRARCFDCYEIRLRCRRDYAATRLWPRLGFVAVCDVRGRAGILTVWRYEMAALPLLRALSERPADLGSVRVVIDANVFFDLDETAAGESESVGLVADWLSDFVELSITEELSNEINRRSDRAERERQRSRARRFVVAPRNVLREEEALPVIRNLLAQPDSPSAESDARQLAMTVAADVTFFVTRDGLVQQAADALHDAFGIQVLAPYEVVRHFDELRRRQDYEPRRLFFGPGVRSRSPRADDLEPLVDLLHRGQTAPEPRRHTAARMREMVASPDRCEGTCIEQGGELLAAFFLERTRAGTLSVPFFAVASSSLGRTAARHYGAAVVAKAVEDARTVVQVREAGVRVGEALSELGFSQENEGWIKIALPGAHSLTSAAAHVDEIGRENPPAAALARRLADELRLLAETPHPAALRVAELERTLWPAKLCGLGIQNFIVPIRPRWAMELFDHELAAGTLFGADPSLVLNCENVYYRAPRPAILTAPARVLWYVSDDVNYPGSMAIRACSLVDEVVVGPPKELFRRFQRLGVYAWNDVFDLARKDTSKDVMAFRFSKTELLRQPVTFDRAQRVLKGCTGRGSQFQSPLMVSEECFLSLYDHAAQPDGA